MAHTLELAGLKNTNDINTLTTALISLEGVDKVEVAQHWAEVEGRIPRSAVEEAIRHAGFMVKK